MPSSEGMSLIYRPGIFLWNRRYICLQVSDGPQHFFLPKRFRKCQGTQFFGYIEFNPGNEAAFIITTRVTLIWKSLCELGWQMESSVFSGYFFFQEDRQFYTAVSIKGHKFDGLL